MTYAELSERLKADGVRFGLRLVVESPLGRLDDEVKAALAEHKPLIVARVSGALQRAALDAWEWGSQPGNGTPPF